MQQVFIIFLTRIPFILNDQYNFALISCTEIISVVIILLLVFILKNERSFSLVHIFCWVLDFLILKKNLIWTNVAKQNTNPTIFKLKTCLHNTHINMYYSEKGWCFGMCCPNKTKFRNSPHKHPIKLA